MGTHYLNLGYGNNDYDCRKGTPLRLLYIDNNLNGKYLYQLQETWKIFFHKCNKFHMFSQGRTKWRNFRLTKNPDYKYFGHVGLVQAHKLKFFLLKILVTLRMNISIETSMPYVLHNISSTFLFLVFSYTELNS